MRLGQVDLQEAEDHIQVAHIILVSISGWLDDVAAGVGM